MVALPQTFNTSDVPADEFEPVPAGTYTGMITESEMKATNGGDGAYIQLKVELEGGRVLFERLNIQNKNDKAVEIAYRTLAKICEAVGKTSVKDTNELHNKRFQIVVAVEPGKPYTDKTTGEQKAGRDQNVIKKWLPYGQENKEAAGGGVSPSAAASPAAANTPPWKR